MDRKMKDVMTRDVETVTPDMTIKEAALIMKSKNIGSLPVVEGRRIVGVITDRDIAIRGVADGRDPEEARVDDVMSEDVVSVREDADLEEAEKLMHDRQIRRLPVVNDKGELSGYLAMAKIARTESPERTGKVIQGVSQASQPVPMDAVTKKRVRKSG